ncbi:MAG: phosphatidylglycerol lysyltransferase domain-containing protein [Pseudoflavonifractor sp.]|nr:phosphatidylglycerol lysyltransferase domain-containing protein [Alloprevotella sp.]MCM1117661.1 phosphatidylglycerol lysyltransferase domain-containing protein [Pseudoflavonifractor sp.]
MQPVISEIATDKALDFKPFTYEEIMRLTPMLTMSPSRTCDFTIGGIYLWQHYFMYTRAIVDDTLFIRGVAEDNLTMTAYSLPQGRLPLTKSMPLLQRHVEMEGGGELLLSAVPEDRLGELACAAQISRVEELPDWADYLYEIEPMATFAGKAMSKKRNHVHRFEADHPDALFESMTAANIPAALDFLARHSAPAPDKSVTADYDIIETAETLRHLDRYPTFEGAVLRAPGRGVVAFTIGEVIGDTLYVHIEKMDHEVNGSGETISSRFCQMMRERYPWLRYVNREDSSGDPGLARAKEAYHPCGILRKYNVWVSRP